MPPPDNTSNDFTSLIAFSTLPSVSMSGQAIIVIATPGKEIDLGKECKGVPKSSCLTKEQRLSLQMDEFMNRRYEFRYNTHDGSSGYLLFRDAGVVTIFGKRDY